MDCDDASADEAKMETTCDCCDQRITDERDCYEYEPTGILVCEQCHEMLLSAPIETDDLDIDMEDLTIG